MVSVIWNGYRGIIVIQKIIWYFRKQFLFSFRLQFFPPISSQNVNVFDIADNCIPYVDISFSWKYLAFRNTWCIIRLLWHTLKICVWMSLTITLIERDSNAYLQRYFFLFTCTVLYTEINKHYNHIKFSTFIKSITNDENVMSHRFYTT